MSLAEWSNRYLYNEDNIERFAPLSGGVYRLIFKKDEKYIVFYVGKSENLDRRLREHLSPSEPDPCIERHLRNYTCYFRFIRIDSETERDREEQSQIQEYAPNCND